MNKRLKRGTIPRVPLFILCGLVLLTSLLSGLLGAGPVSGDGSIGISGTWDSQILQIPQGSSVRAQGSYVTVFNPTGDSPITVNMNTITPPGVTVSLSTTEFVVQPGGQREVYVQQVAVSADAIPGDYQIEVIALATYENAGGVQLLPAAAQVADLTVTGESGLVVVDIVSPSGQPIWAVIRLFKVINGNPYEFAYSTTGNLEATVSPGHYRVEAYSSSGEQLAEPQEFDISDGEEQRLTLTANTIYFDSFAINPAYNTETGELGYVQIVYTANNVYQPVANAEIRLTVTLNGAPLEEISIFTLNPFNVGRMGVPYNYVPTNGWQDGTYGFSVQLYVDGELYASTQEQTLELGEGGGGGGSSLNWLFFILAGLGGGLLIGVIIMFFKRRKKRDKPEKDRKLEKRGEKEKPPEPGEATGTVFGVKRLFGRGDKTAKKGSVPAKGAIEKGVAVAGTIAAREATGASATAKKDDKVAAQTKEPAKASPAVDIGKVADKKAIGGQAPAAGKESVTAKDSAAARPSAAGQAAAAAPKAAPAAAFQVKSAADLKKVAASRRAEDAKPSVSATPTATSKQVPPVKESPAAPTEPAKRPLAAASGTSPAQAEPDTETLPAGASAAAVSTKPKKREAIVVPSPFAPPKQVPSSKKAKLDKKSAARRPVAPPAGALPKHVPPVKEVMPIKDTAVPTEQFEVARKPVAPEQQASVTPAPSIPPAEPVAETVTPSEMAVHTAAEAAQTPVIPSSAIAPEQAPPVMEPAPFQEDAVPAAQVEAAQELAAPIPGEVPLYEESLMAQPAEAMEPAVMPEPAQHVPETAPEMMESAVPTATEDAQEPIAPPPEEAPVYQDGVIAEPAEALEPLDTPEPTTAPAQESIPLEQIEPFRPSVMARPGIPLVQAPPVIEPAPFQEDAVAAERFEAQEPAAPPQEEPLVTQESFVDQPAEALEPQVAPEPAVAPEPEQPVAETAAEMESAVPTAAEAAEATAEESPPLEQIEPVRPPLVSRPGIPLMHTTPLSKPAPVQESAVVEDSGAPSEAPGDADAGEGQSPEKPQEDDEASKKFRSPINFFNR